MNNMRQNTARHGKVMVSRLGRGNVDVVPDARCSASMLPSFASMLSTNCVIAKDVKSCTYFRSIRCATLLVRVEGNALAPKQGQLITMHS